MGLFSLISGQVSAARAGVKTGLAIYLVELVQQNLVDQLVGQNLVDQLVGQHLVDQPVAQLLGPVSKG